MSSREYDAPIKLPSTTGTMSDAINQRFFRFIQENSDWTYLRHAEVLGVSEATVKRCIGELKKAGFIRHEGSDKTGDWIA